MNATRIHELNTHIAAARREVQHWKETAMLRVYPQGQKLARDRQAAAEEILAELVKKRADLAAAGDPVKMLTNALPDTWELVQCYPENHTDNLPELNPMVSGCVATSRAGEADWDKPNWRISRHACGTVIISANRPTEEEAREGDLTGELGSHIRLAQVTQTSLRNDLRMARRLCRCQPTGLRVHERDLIGIGDIISSIPVFA